MSGGDVQIENRRRLVEPLRSLGLVVLGAMLMFLISRFMSPLSVDLIWIQYPTDQDPPRGDILIVERYQATRLRHAESEQIVRRGTFDVDELFQQLLGQLVNTWDEDKRIDKRVGTVRIWFSNDTSGTFFIYDKSFADEIFDWARANVVGGE